MTSIGVGGLGVRTGAMILRLRGELSETGDSIFPRHADLE